MEVKRGGFVVWIQERLPVEIELLFVLNVKVYHLKPGPYWTKRGG